MNWPSAVTGPEHIDPGGRNVWVRFERTQGLWTHLPKVRWVRKVSTHKSRNSSFFFRTVSGPLHHRFLTLMSVSTSWGLVFDHMTLGASPDSDYGRELKVSSWEGPLETYYWLLSRWLDVFKGLLHSNRIQSHWLYLLLSHENGKRKDGMFVLGIVNFILPGWPGATNSLKLSSWELSFTTGFWTRWLKFMAFLSHQTQGGRNPKENPLASGSRSSNRERTITAI